MYIEILIKNNEKILKKIYLEIDDSKSLYQILGSELHKQKITKLINNYSKNVIGIPSTLNIIEMLNKNFVISKEIKSVKTINLHINYKIQN